MKPKLKPEIIRTTAPVAGELARAAIAATGASYENAAEMNPSVWTAVTITCLRNPTPCATTQVSEVLLVQILLWHEVCWIRAADVWATYGPGKFSPYAMIACPPSPCALPYRRELIVGRSKVHELVRDPTIAPTEMRTYPSTPEPPATFAGNEVSATHRLDSAAVAGPNPMRACTE
eukprot:3785769-Rhodomonas_salina.4